MLRTINSTPTTLGKAISLGAQNENIRQEIMREGTVFCIKNCLEIDAIDALRNAVFDHYHSIPTQKINYNDQLLMNDNYHSIEQGVSQYQKTLHYFHGYIFNNIPKLPASLRTPIHGLFYSLVSFYNNLTAQHLQLGETLLDGKKIRPQIFQYPMGGGMFAAHSHPLEPQKIGMILGFSKRNRDFQEGGTGFESPDGKIIDTSEDHDIGDIILFRYDLKHWVTPCDINDPLNPRSKSGRWTAVIPIY